MKPEQFDAFMLAQKAAVAYLQRFSGQGATVVHHNDTDGITAGAILKTALQRAGFALENIPLERVHPEFVARIHTPARNLILYTDLGGQAADMISRTARKGTGVIILDHHPPSQVEHPNLVQVNPESFGIDGDLQVSAATTAFFFAQALDEKNSDLAHLGVLGAIGDRQVVKGRLQGLNQVAAEIALQNGLLLTVAEGADPFCFPSFNHMRGEAISRHIVDLAVNGYYRGGAQLAVAFCLQGPSPAYERFASEMHQLQVEKFAAEIETLRNRGISSMHNVQWVDVAAHFYPLGLKAIGIFCETIATAEWIHGQKYLAGFQDFPDEIPILGKTASGNVKVSMRVPPQLRKKIEAGRSPDLVQILPPAAARAGGFAEGCHRFAAACNIPAHRKTDLIAALNDVLKNPDA
jgi:hypothetical protein